MCEVHYGARTEMPLTLMQAHARGCGDKLSIINSVIASAARWASTQNGRTPPICITQKQYCMVWYALRTQMMMLARSERINEPGPFHSGVAAWMRRLIINNMRARWMMMVGDQFCVRVQRAHIVYSSHHSRTISSVCVCVCVCSLQIATHSARLRTIIAHREIQRSRAFAARVVYQNCAFLHAPKMFCNNYYDWGAHARTLMYIACICSHSRAHFDL